MPISAEPPSCITVLTSAKSTFTSPVTVINVEPYVLELQDGQLQPVLTDDQLTPAASTNEWRLPTEPWVFVVNRDGVITASLMMIFSDEELEAAITAVE